MNEGEATFMPNISHFEREDFLPTLLEAVQSLYEIIEAHPRVTVDPDEGSSEIHHAGEQIASLLASGDPKGAACFDVDRIGLAYAPFSVKLCYELGDLIQRMESVFWVSLAKSEERPIWLRDLAKLIELIEWEATTE